MDQGGAEMETNSDGQHNFRKRGYPYGCKMSRGRNNSWTAIVLTCQNKDSAQLFQDQLELRQKKGLIDPDALILTVEDPKALVGSGGATLNALVVVAEHLSALQSYTVINADVLQDARILILHLGRIFPFDPCGRAFVTVPLEPTAVTAGESLITALDLLIETMTNTLAVKADCGVWVCSTDMFLDVPHKIDFSWPADADVVAVSVPGTVQYAQDHGVYKIAADGSIEDIVYKGTQEAIVACATNDGTVPLVSGVVYFNTRTAERLLSFHVLPPLNACTYMGLDSGAKTIMLSLFFDFMLAMCSDVSEDAFVSGERSGRYGTNEKMTNDHLSTMQKARSHLWRELRGSRLRAVVISGEHRYMDAYAQAHHKNLTRGPMIQAEGAWKFVHNSHSWIADDCNVDHTAVLINSVLESRVSIGANTVVSHCHLGPGIRIGAQTCVAGLQLDDQRTRTEIGDNIVLQRFHLSLSALQGITHQSVYTIIGREDNVTAFNSTFCNRPWDEFFLRTGIRPEELWDKDMPDERKCILNARVYPVCHTSHALGLHDVLWLHSQDEVDPDMLTRWRTSWRLTLEEILSYVYLKEEFNWRRQLFFDVADHEVRDVLLNGRDRGLNRLYYTAVVENHGLAILKTLDRVACECNSPDIAARTLGNIADVLGCMAGERGGLRSGPAANSTWSAAFKALEVGQIQEGVKALAEERNKWLDRPDLLIRAARHYEGAAQRLIRQAVMTARKYMTNKPCTMPEMERWVRADCPARADLSGGWSDTPPITYEHGGAVMNVAVLVDGQKPIGAKARRIPEPHLVLYLEGNGAGSKIILTNLSDLSDYSQPQSPGALLKAAFVCAEVVDYPCSRSLHDQLMERYGGGFELHTWSTLPHGSGLGTSSILAGAVMAVIWRVSGKVTDTESLNHAVLHLEQMLTSGGGWQDQVGGLIGGAKVGHSPAKLPLFVDCRYLNVSDETINAFNERFVLIYTGKTRLARNLVQNVIRNWYARDPVIVQTQDSLVRNAWLCAEAFEQGNLAEVGACMNRYWTQKKKMASGCEPVAVGHMMEALRPHAHGLVLAGAGGGGFMYALMKEANAFETVQNILSTVKGAESVSIHQGSMDLTGITVTLETDT